MGLKQKTFAGFIWTSLGVVGNGLTNIIVTMILARLLTPNDFALIELLAIFIAVSGVFIDSGFSQAVIRDDNPSQTDLSSVFFFNLTVSIVLYILLFFAAPYIAAYFNAPQLTSLSRCTFLVLIFNSLCIIQNANFNRQLNFKAQTLSNVIGMLCAGIIAIIMAFCNCGIWALVANMTLYPLFRSIVLWIQSRWKPSWSFSFSSIKRYFKFGGFLLFRGLMDAIVTNLISIITGKAYSKTELGYMSQGRKVDGYVVTPVNSIIVRVTYPVLAKLKNNPALLKEGSKQIVKAIMFLYVPLIMFTMATADNIIVVLFGNKWIEAGKYLAIASVGGFFYPLQNIFENVCLVKGKSNTLLYCAIIKQGIRLLSLLLTIPYGVIVLYWSFVLSGIIGSLLYIVLGMHYVKYSFWELINDLWKTVLITLLGISIVFLFDKQTEMVPLVTLFIQIMLMVGFYWGVSLLFNRTQLKEDLSLFSPFVNKIFRRKQ